jgi:60 kDa SS-A/Ro ribonucleoprotein
MSYLNKYTNPAMKTQTNKLNDRQAQNNAGGYSFVIDKWEQLRRFLILGTQGGTYYATEKKITQDNLDVINACIEEDGIRVIDLLKEISDSGRAPKNDQAIMALAKASCSEKVSVKRAAWDALRSVCRIGTHLYQFVEFRKNFGGGWGRATKKAIGDWFINRPSEKMALQVAKYKQREGWSARDLLRLSHPKTDDEIKNEVLKWVVSSGEYNGKKLPSFLKACNEVKEANEKRIIQLIEQEQLPREVLPTECLNNPHIWEAMLPHMGATAMVRNLGKMSSIGLLEPNSKALKFVCSSLENETFIKESRIHPISVLTALYTYGNGKGVKGSLSWIVNRNVLASLEDAFYHSFKNVEPTGKNTMLGLDVSGSMRMESVMGVYGLTARDICATMAMITIRTEKSNCTPVCFSTNLIDFPISRTDSLEAVIKKMDGIPFGGTDCSLPILHALEKKIPVDTFVIYTDNETWAGKIHPSEALKKYRAAMKINAKLIVCGITATNFSIADPKDSGMLDIVGFDSAAPQIISEFTRE